MKLELRYFTLYCPQCNRTYVLELLAHPWVCQHKEQHKGPLRVKGPFK